MGLTRRNFLKYSSSLAIGAGLTDFMVQSLSSSPTYKDQLHAPGRLEETFANSICGECGAGCGVRVRLVDGIPVKVSGNNLHPINQGGLCARGQASLQMLYNPDRFKGPLQRNGERGSGKWQGSSWEPALEKVVSAIQDLIKTNKTDEILILTNDRDELLSHIIARFSQALGLRHVYQLGLTRDPYGYLRSLTGREHGYAFDFRNTKYIMSFGARLLESEPSMGWYNRIFGEMRGNTNGRRIKMVQLDPQLSISGIKADEWIPLKPGSYGDLALGIAHLLILEDLYDKDFMRKVSGFEDRKDRRGVSRTGLKNQLLSHSFSPAAVAERCGIKARTIIRLAHEFAANRPAIALAGERCLWHTNGAGQAQAIHLLNALVGSFGVDGGILGIQDLPANILAGAAKEQSPKETLYAKIPQITADDLLQLFESNELQPSVLLNFTTDPTFMSCQPEKMKSAMARIPLIVSFSSLPDDATNLADWILPDHTSYEKWQLASAPPGFLGANISISPPLLKPLYNTRSSSDVLLTIAKRLTNGSNKIVPWDTSEQYLKSVAKILYQNGNGIPFSESYDESWIRLLEERGWRYPQTFSTFKEFWAELLEKGGWWLPNYQDEEKVRTFATPSKKIDVTQLVDFLDKTFGNLEGDAESGSEQAGTPEQIESDEKTGKKAHEFLLNIYEITSLGRDGRGAYSPMLLEISANHIKQKWNSWVEINPHDAEQLHLKNSDWVWLVSGDRKLKVQVRIYAGTWPKMVSVPLGLGHKVFGHYARGVGINPIHLVRDKRDEQTGQVAWLETTVKIIRIKNGEKENA